MLSHVASETQGLESVRQGVHQTGSLA